jgi:hypothetical protein
MPYIRSLQQLRRRFEELVDGLDVCHDSNQRRELLEQMKGVVDETDKLIFIEILQSGPMQDRTYPP